METHTKLQDALLEIGAEEIPSAYIPPALAFMKDQAETFLKTKRLSFKSVQVLGTPRRLALIVSGVPAKSESVTEEVLGPKLAAAKDAAGGWTLAAQGFAKSQGVSLSALQTRQSPKGEVLCAVKKHEGLPAEKVFAELFSHLPGAIPFPKKMVWEESLFKFARPIRNLVALLGGKVLRFTIAGIKSSNKTFTLSHTSSRMISIASPQAYAGILKNNCILADFAARKELIRSSVSQLAKKVKGVLHADEDLLEEVSWLVEHPVGILGSFDSEFLSLPQEILITCMKKHQKFFSITDAAGKLTPHFVGIRNGISEHQEIVRGGYEKVLRARLYDAKFFFDEDLRRSLEFFVVKSNAITVQERLGSVADRIARMKLIGLKISDASGVSGLDRSSVERALHLCKFDLSTKVVYEYPELQGIIGEIYCRHFGENPKVASAVKEHYYPVNAQGPVPQSAESKVVALTEKLEGLCGNFWLGVTPSGNADPYGLRRSSSGILRILLEAGWDISVRDLVQYALEQFASRGPGAKDQAKLVQDIVQFLTERFHLSMQEAGFETDEIYSVTKNSHDPDAQALKIISLREKIHALHLERENPDFEAVAGAYKRAGNILRQARQKGMEVSMSRLDASLLRDPAEQNLHSMLEGLHKKAEPLLLAKQYRAALQNWVKVRPELDQFFEKVMVMDPDEKVCANRLSLLSVLETRFHQLADFSLIQNRSASAQGEKP